jgi:hypothetical protein
MKNVEKKTKKTKQLVKVLKLRSLRRLLRLVKQRPSPPPRQPPKLRPRKLQKSVPYRIKLRKLLAPKPRNGTRCNRKSHQVKRM